MRFIFYAHLATIICGALVVRSNTILSNRILEFAIALPLFSTWFICPVTMLVVVIAKRPRSPMFRMLAVLADVVLSTIQIFTWLPTVQ